MKNYGAWCGVVWRWWWRGAFHISICISLCPWHMFAQTQAAIVEGCLRRRGASLHVQATTAVAVCWQLVAMLAPIKLNKQWPIEGGAYRSKPIGLDTRDVDTASGPVSFIKLEKHADWLLKVTTGNSGRGALRRATIFGLLAKRLEETVANPESRWTPERSGSSAVAESGSGSGSGSSAVAESGSPASGTIDPMSQLEDLGSDSATPKKRKAAHYESKRGINRIQFVSMPEYEPISHPNRTEERTVRVLPLSTCSLWLSINDTPWLVRWLGDELRSGGVPLESSDPMDALECNCNAEHVHIR